MMNMLNIVHTGSCRAVRSAALSADRAVRSFDALRVFFWGFWGWRRDVSVC